jgi:phage terminase large subunit-like protein
MMSARSGRPSFFPTYLVHTKGKWAGRPFHLSPWQAAIVRMLFGWKRASGIRLLRRALIWVARGNGKSEFAAGLLLLAWLFDGELGGEGYVIASDKKQAGVVFTMATRMVQLSSELAERIETFKTSLYCSELLASIQPLSGQAEGKHGLSCSVLAGDEMHEWPNGDLYEFVKQSEIKREQPLEILISTAGQARRGYGWVLWEESLKIRDETFDDPTTLVVIYAADPADDWTKPETWVKANPNVAVSVQIGDLQEIVNRALESPRLETNFKRYHLDIWVGQDSRWLSIENWRKSSGKPSLAADARWRSFPELMKGRACYGSLDLSSTNDLTCLLWMFPPEGEQKKWIVIPRFWVPADNVERRARRDRVPYDQWEQRGAIEPTTGNVVDYEPVIAAIHEGMSAYGPKQVGYDPYNARATVNTLMNEGVPMIELRQGPITLGEASKQLERLIESGMIDSGGHPVLDWMVSNVAKHEDRRGNITPDKAKSSEKIDGIVCMVMDLALATTAIEPEYTLGDMLANSMMS